MHLDLDPQELTFHHLEMPINGTEALYTYHTSYSCPIGFIWFEQKLRDLTVLQYIFVHEACRRQRLASIMLRKLQAWYPGNAIATARGNEFSEPWLKACHFTPEPNGWFLRPAEPCPMI